MADPLPVHRVALLPGSLGAGVATETVHAAHQRGGARRGARCTGGGRVKGQGPNLNLVIVRASYCWALVSTNVFAVPMVI